MNGPGIANLLMGKALTGNWELDIDDTTPAIQENGGLTNGRERLLDGPCLETL